MSWLLNLYETYDANLDRVGEVERKFNGQEFTLLPISHTTQTAHLEVTITEDGRFHSADFINKSDANTLIPCTEDSASRAGSVVAPYPLHDKISYVAGDHIAYGGEVKKEDPFTSYINNLQGWVDSPHGHAKVKSIYNYLKQGRLIQDLVEVGKLVVDENNRLIGKWDKKYTSLYPEKPMIFSAIAGEQDGAFIRFNIRSKDKIKVWEDREVYESFIQFYQHKLSDERLCYVTGKSLPSTDKHANKIRNAADKAKLISANDKSGFTYRGRFSQSDEAASISYEVSQKAHNALKWLINRQGKIIDQRVFLVWANHEVEVIPPEEDSLFYGSDSIVVNEQKAFTNESFAHEISKALEGYKNRVTTDMSINLIVLDSATTGRMAVLYYRNMDKQLYFERIIHWHSTCVWLHRYRKNESGEPIQFYGAPATKDIAFAAYGLNANEKVVKGLMERMLPCIVDGTRIPLDIVKSAVGRASNPVSMDKWEWEKTLSIACSLLNKTLLDKGEGYEVALDKENMDRDYLFGRLLAVADVLERRALGSDEKRASNAIRYMNSFSQHPARTWSTIQASLQPYQAKLGMKAIDLSKLIDEIASNIKYEDFNNRPLSGKYLLGYYSQRHDYYQSKKKNEDTEEQSNKEEM
ncbi:type I-C CRISPR-associated protein Cas8c/Csd1 [Paenibacillus sp. N1-5-1-14]|uniref:type I-C CRISPR-associated protein Cas8c/Csd1 n=1 Tax=Paenibacillus radicibacter TaxID=2972488 RepID=UPI002158DBA5|nr:type I-C CRISPR-associated protein Cas8c/Csd1 [Paenibacillus radicibacter]MCR8644610.1 type I-C CRISPR-associated protein Cas8c/Csd1 [Paenibacillus radicibacter]